MRRMVAGAVVTSVLLSGCVADGDEEPEALPTARFPIPTATPTPTPTPVPQPEPTVDVNAPVQLAHGVTLEPGRNGRLPVRVRWTHQGVFPEEFAVDVARKEVYLDDEFGTALDLRTGDLLWEAVPDRNGEGLNSDGGDVIGRSGRSGIRFFAPFNYDYTIDRDTGQVIDDNRTGSGDVPAGLRPFPRPQPRRYRVSVGLRQAVALWPDGSVAWRIRVAEPWFDGRGPVAVPGGVAVLLSNGLLVVLDDGRA